MKEVEYYYIIMSQKSLLENQVIEEILRERATYYSIKNKTIDFWVLISPNFIYSNNLIEKIRKSNFFNNNKKSILFSEFSTTKNLEFYSSLVTTDKEFLNWFKLRIGYFEDINKLENDQFTSDGIFGVIKSNDKQFSSILQSNSNFLNPSILINRYKKSLELYLNNQKEN